MRALAERRRQLDQARAAALDLIFDDDRYFYPNRRPAVSAERAREYFLIQLEVDHLIQEVERLVREAPVVTFSSSFQGRLQELAALAPVATEFQVRLPVDPKVPGMGADAEWG